MDECIHGLYQKVLVSVCVCVFVCYLHVGGVPCCITFNAMCVYSMHVL